MAKQFYVQPGLHTELYDLMHDSDDDAIEGDVDFYVQAAVREGGPVLELGAGTGRITIPLARAGLETVGLDHSRVMLDQAAAKVAVEDEGTRSRVSLIQGDMAAFAVQETFATVLVPFRAFQMLLTPEAERSCLEAVHHHLVPGGLLVVDLFDPRLDLLAPRDVLGPEVDFDGRHPLTGNRVRAEILGRRNDRVEQVFSQRWRFSEFEPSGAVLRQEEETLRLRWLYRYEMRYLLELSGFTVEYEYSNFRGDGPAYGREQIYLARAR